jgi:hypothetical protein
MPCIGECVQHTFFVLASKTRSACSFLEDSHRNVCNIKFNIVTKEFNYKQGMQIKKELEFILPRSHPSLHHEHFHIWHLQKVQSAFSL